MRVGDSWYSCEVVLGLRRERGWGDGLVWHSTRALRGTGNTDPDLPHAHNVDTARQGAGTQYSVVNPKLIPLVIVEASHSPRFLQIETMRYNRCSRHRTWPPSRVGSVPGCNFFCEGHLSEGCRVWRCGIGRYSSGGFRGGPNFPEELEALEVCDNQSMEPWYLNSHSAR